MANSDAASERTWIDGGAYQVDWENFDAPPDVTFSLVGWPGTSSVIPSPGQVVRMYDPDGNRCLGIAESFENGLLAIRCLWQTWTDAHRVEWAR